MSEWAKVDGSVALKMMEASAEITDLNHRFENLQLDIALGRANGSQIFEVRGQCNKLSRRLGTILYALDEAENAAKAEKLKIVK